MITLILIYFGKTAGGRDSLKAAPSGSWHIAILEKSPGAMPQRKWLAQNIFEFTFYKSSQMENPLPEGGVGSPCK